VEEQGSDVARQRNTVLTEWMNGLLVAEGGRA